MSSIVQSRAQIHRAIRAQQRAEATPNGHGAFGMSPLVRSGANGFGFAMIIAAIGIWLVPAEDPAGHLIKLGSSILMFCFGAILLFHAKGAHEPRRVEFDTAKRQLRTFAVDDRGELKLNGAYNLDGFSEVSLQTGVLFARDPEKGLVVSVPVKGRAKAEAIRKALQLG